MIGKTNAGGAGGGVGATANDAILWVTAPTGSTVSITRDGVVKTAVGWESSTEGLSDYLIVVKATLFSSSPWTLNATNGTSSAEDTIVINDNVIYTVTISYRLPANMVEVQYLQSSGVQYIDTGLSASSIKRGYVNSIITGDKQWAFLFGASNSSSSAESYALSFRPHDGYFFVSNNGSMNFANITAANSSCVVEFTIAANNSLVATVNGVQKLTTGTIGDYTSKNVWLFTDNLGNSYGGNQYAVKAKIFGVQFWDENDNLIGDFIPCKRTTDGVYGFVNTAASPPTFHPNLHEGVADFTSDLDAS